MSMMTDKIANAEHVSEYSLLFNGNLTVEHAEIAFRNFGARGTKANPAGGKRTFCLMLSADIAQKLYENGWNVKVKEIRDQYVEDERTLTVSWTDYCLQYIHTFDHAMIYTEIVVSENGTPPAEIYKASEYNGEKTVAKVPVDHWDELDKSVMGDIRLAIHPWVHGRNKDNPDAKKGYLSSLVAKIQPVVGVDLGSSYADYRVVGA